jgi:hypothetical protein
VCLLRDTDWVFKYNSGFNKNPRAAHTMYLCVLYGSQNKQRLFPYTALTDWFFITEAECVYCAVRTGSSNQTDAVSSLKV